MKCAIFFAEGFEECEGLIIVDVLRRGNVGIDTVSITDSREVLSSHQVEVKTDKVWNEIKPDDYDVLILPGGKLGTENLEHFAPLTATLKKHCEAGRLTCAICAAPSILGHLGLLKHRNYTSFPAFSDPSYEGDYQMELAVHDGNVITGRGMGATIDFALEILKTINPNSLEHVEYGIQYEHAFRTLKKPM
ncbi:MAG: DJ-1/PfpI family protein [Solobacterium sp.]|jgi:4-methyl-5(b-hydroxyethyl)-thiazole monophosphate biosynthesis|nr:DJ-1/PfpI family protein [Solobacterium sp.]MCH4222814.1 DJ-1/PfpI family protein [Solobacterium sp.]MCH4266285.1 DJ-1/PfpI family protein [Solobacterium sp.]